MSAINDFLLQNQLRLRRNPCVSPDFCLDWPGLQRALADLDSIHSYPESRFETADGHWILAANDEGDHAWLLNPHATGARTDRLEGGLALSHGRWAYPATFNNLLRLKNLIQETDPESSIFPTAGGDLGKRSLGVGARFTTLHWPAVEWAMVHLGIGLTANQNSIPRELVYDVDAMLSGNLDTVPFPFIGANVPEGHQGQSVEGMSHGCVLSKLKTGFHRHRIPWSFNADHQPIGGKFDSREDQLVSGCALASYITFDLSPELAATKAPESAEARAAYVVNEIGPELVVRINGRLGPLGLDIGKEELDSLLCSVWPAMAKMKRRDEKYRAIRNQLFTTDVGRAYLRELSIDELPGLTTPQTTAVMLALCEVLEMPVQYVAPAFGFQKNLPYPNNNTLHDLIERQWKVCRAFGVSIGFHSGSGKSADNYQAMGSVTGGRLEIKTSGRYTYEMGRALAGSKDAGDQQLWQDWYVFTRDLVVRGAFSDQEEERRMARAFVLASLDEPATESELFASPEACRSLLEALRPDPERMFWFEYNFLFVLAAEGRADKAALGDHSPSGYRQRARFYAISDEARLAYAKNVARYLIFLAEHTGLAKEAVCAAARERLKACPDYGSFIAGIGRGQ